MQLLDGGTGALTDGDDVVNTKQSRPSPYPQCCRWFVIAVAAHSASECTRLLCVETCNARLYPRFVKIVGLLFRSSYMQAIDTSQVVYIIRRKFAAEQWRQRLVNIGE